MFRSPEHALQVAFAFATFRIEPRNATASVIDSLKAKRAQLRAATGLSQHDWHAQAAMAMAFAERTLSTHPLLWQAVLAEYSHDVRGALAVQQISQYAVPDAEGRDRLIADALVTNLLRGRPRYRDISDAYDIALGPLSRLAKPMREPVLGLRDRAVAVLAGPMEASGLVS